MSCSPLPASMALHDVTLRQPGCAQTYETVDRLELDAFEQGCSLISVSFADDPNAYYAMGSAHVIADEPEPSKVHPRASAHDLMSRMVSSHDLPYTQPHPACH